MKHTRTRLATAVAVAATSMATLGAISPAHAATNPADPTFVPVAADFVGVGSDTSQLALHHLAEGIQGTPGWNAANPGQRLASWAANGDPSTISVVGGTTAITRPNGSGAGKTKLYGQNNDDNIDFARSSSGPSAAENTAGLQNFPFAVDGLKLAVATSATNAPDTITDEQLVNIYKGSTKNWNEIGGKDGLIKPFIPQSGSGTRSFFEAQLTRANKGTPVTLGSVSEMQENDPAPIEKDPNAVAPFSTGRAKSAPSVKLLGGFQAQRALYNVTRGAAATTADVQRLFGSAGFVCSDAARPLIAAAGFEQLARPKSGGVCGVQTQAATSNFKVAGDNASTTTLTAKATPDGTATLTASVTPVTAEGSVVFTEDGETVATADVDSLGKATGTVEGLAAGSSHTYEATFTPSDAEFSDSTSSAVTVKVPAGKYDGSITVSNPSGSFGVARTVTVDVKSVDAAATGDVSFVYGDAASSTKALANGRASFALPSTLGVGTYYGVASFGGDANFERQFQLVKFTVAKASTTTTLKLAASRVKVKKSTKATVTVALRGSTVKANGTVTLKVGSTTVGTGKVVNGTASVTVKALSTTGKKAVKATFTPSSGNYGGSTGTGSYTVVK